MQEPDFWSDINKAQEVTGEEKFVKSRLDRYEQLHARIEDIEVLTTLSIEEADFTNSKEILREVKDLQDDVDRLRFEIFLS
jgi:peptide chain release factor 2